MTDLRHPNKHFVIGVIIVCVGIALLLGQLGLAEANEIFRLWPLILIYFGVQKLITAHNVTSRFWGGFITLLGISFQLEALGLRGINFGTIWPVFLICAGVLMVWRHYERGNGPYYNQQPPMPPPPPGPPSPDAPNPTSEPPAAAPSGPQASFTSTTTTNPNAATSTPPPQPPNYGSSWDRHAWKQQRAWEKFQRRMERMNAHFNENTQAPPPNTNWQVPPGPPRPPNPPHWGGSGNWQDTSQPYLDDVYVFWGGRRRILSKNFIGGDIVAIFGGFEIDLTQADFTAQQIEIEMVAIFGGGELRVPANWEVIVENVGIFGGTTDRTWHPNAVPPGAAAPTPPVKRLIIKGVAIFGGLTIKN